MTCTLTWNAVWSRRMARHNLTTRAPAEQLAAVVGAVCGIHAQLLPAAALSLGLRLEGVTAGDVRAALWETRRLVKTYGIRGTLHVFPAAELPLWLAALRRRQTAREHARLAQMGLDAAQLSAVVDAIGQALDGQALTLSQLGEEVARRVGAWALDATAPAFGGAWPRWRMALGWAASEGVLCYGPNVGAQVTFVQPGQWLGVWQLADPDGALREVFRRFLRAYGPVAERDFAQWFNIPRRLVRELTDDLAAELVGVDVEGWRGLMLADDLDAPTPSVAETARLLPHFDCYLRGAFPRAQLLGAWGARASGGTGNVPVLLVGGVLGGVWEQRRVGRATELRVEPFTPLSPAQQADLESEAARVGAILETEVTLTYGPVSARPHL